MLPKDPRNDFDSKHPQKDILLNLARIDFGNRHQVISTVDFFAQLQSFNFYIQI